MYITRLNLVAVDDRVPTSSEAELVHDILWQYARPEADVQHITVTAMPYGLDVVFFFADKNDLKRRSLEIVGQASAASGVIGGWLALSALPPLIAQIGPDGLQLPTEHRPSP